MLDPSNPFNLSVKNFLLEVIVRIPKQDKCVNKLRSMKFPSLSSIKSHMDLVEDSGQKHVYGHVLKLMGFLTYACYLNLAISDSGEANKT